MSREFESLLRIMRDSLAGIDPADIRNSETRYAITASSGLLTLLLASDMSHAGVPRDPWAPVAGGVAPPCSPESHEALALVADEAIALVRRGEDPAASGAVSGVYGRKLIARHQWIEDRLKTANREISVRDVRPPRIGTDRMNGYFRSRNIDATAAEVAYIPGGFSRETLLVSLEPGTRFGEEIILRKVVDGHDPQHLIREWGVITHVSDLDLLSPSPLWLEEDPEALGNAFFAVTRMPGRNPGDVFGSGEPVSASLFEQLAGHLARLHAASIDGLGALPRKPMISAATVRAAIDEMAEVAPRLAPHDRPLFDFVIAWMRANIPPDVERPSLLHGDIGWHNLLIEDGSLSAILDWERSHLGNPAEELAYIYDMVVRTMPWPAFMDEYAAHGGQPPSEDVLRFYSIWSDIWRISGGLDKRWLFLNGPSPRISAAVAGFLVAPRFLISAVNRVLGIEAGI